MRARHAIFAAGMAVLLAVPAVDAAAGGQVVQATIRPAPAPVPTPAPASPPALVEPSAPSQVVIVRPPRQGFESGPQNPPPITHGPIVVESPRPPQPPRECRGPVVRPPGPYTGGETTYVDSGTTIIAPPSEPADPGDGGATVTGVPPVDPAVLEDAVRGDMEQVRRRVLANLLGSAQWVRVNADLAKTVDDVNAARARVEQSLAGRPDYQAAAADKKAARDLSDALHAKGSPTPAQMTPIAERALEAAERLTRIETAALADDPSWVEARARLRALAETRELMSRQVSADVQNDPVWQAARRQLN